MPRTRAGSAKANGPGASGRRRRGQRQHLRDRRAQRDQHPGVALQLLPTHEDDAPARREARAQVREGAPRGSAKNITPKRLKTRSKAAAPSFADCASAFEETRLREARSRGARARARSSIGAEMSIPVTDCRAAPTRSASWSVVWPQPQPTSSTLSPGATRRPLHRRETDRRDLLVEHAPRRRPTSGRPAGSSRRSARRSVQRRGASACGLRRARTRDHTTRAGSSSQRPRRVSRRSVSSSARRKAARGQPRAPSLCRCGVWTWQSRKSKPQAAS